MGILYLQEPLLHLHGVLCVTDREQGMPELPITAASSVGAGQSSAVQDLFKQVHRIPSVPRLVQELIQQFGSKTARADDIAEKIQLDQALSLKVLRLANSVHFGVGRKVSSIDYAVVLLGFDRLKILVIASGVTSACKSIPGMNRERFWRCAFSVASIAKLIARQMRKDTEMAFTCGMLHNIGDALMYLVHTEKMLHIDKQVDAGAERAQLQRSEFGYDYAQVGAELTSFWKFPTAIAAAIRHQLNPEVAAAEADYATIVNLAVATYRQVEAYPNHEELLRNIPTAKLRAAGVDPAVFMENLVVLLDQVDDIQNLLA